MNKTQAIQLVARLELAASTGQLAMRGKNLEVSQSGKALKDAIAVMQATAQFLTQTMLEGES